MVTPTMATITASLERSLQNCSLNHQQSNSSSSSSTTTTGDGREAADHSSPINLSTTAPTLELNSQASLPFHWEQCLDLKTGEIYYTNWTTGMKAKEDPRTTSTTTITATTGEGEGEEEEEYYYYSDNESTSYESDGSCSESSPSPSPSPSSSRREQQWSGNINEIDNVLVVGGCKSCLMYYMVPKLQLNICPKCCGQLLHF